MLVGSIIVALIFWVAVLFIFYTYFGYPLLIWLLASLKGRGKAYSEEYPHVTFMIAAYNEENVIGRKIENALALDYPHEKLQILVAADGSNDQTPNIVRNYESQGVELSYIPDRGGKMAAIVRALLVARGEIVVFSDANNMYDAQAVRKLVTPFADGTVGLTTGAKLIVEDERNLSSAEGLYWKYESAIKKNETILGTCTVAVGEIVAVRKNLFVPPQGKIINDDHYMVLSMIQQGYRVIYVPEARSYEYVSQTARDEIERRSRMNAGLFQTIAMSRSFLKSVNFLILWEIVSHKFFRAFIPFALFFALLSNLILVFLPNVGGVPSFWALDMPFDRIFLGLQLLFYFLAMLGNFFSLNGAAGKILYLPTFLVNSNLAVAAGFYNFVTKRQSHVWKRVRR